MVAMSEARPGPLSGAPNVFISSTSEDLKEYRERAMKAAVAAELRPVMNEDFEASGARTPLAECMARVGRCDVLVAIVAHRYGWKPKGGRGKSITWLECEEAIRCGREVLAFIVDDNHEWPAHFRDSHQAHAVKQRAKASKELRAELDRDLERLAAFKKWLAARRIRATFGSPDEFQRKVEAALREWLRRPASVPPKADPGRYLGQLREECSWIDIRGLQVGTGRAHRFPIEELYIPLAMAAAPDREHAKMPERREVPLEQALAHRHLVVVGDPGSGKTTFLRHVALARVRETESRKSADFPIFIRIAELLEHIRRRPGSNLAEDSPMWLIDFLAWRSKEFNQGLDQDFFRQKCENGPAIVMLDGLDEAPNTRERETAVRLFEKATRAFRNCRFVVSTRPLSYAGRGVLAGFETAAIEPLEAPAIHTFLERWCAALFPESAAAAKKHQAELTGALRSVPEIRRMARNPVMLTALAVVHWNERRLPEQRADLYESILNWLARSRDMRAGRASADRCLQLLQQLALAMQAAPQGRRVQIEKGEAANALARWFESPVQALAFLEQEEVDSGIVVSRGTELRFWHLTFQEYLAARAIGGMEEAEQRALLLCEDAIYRIEWREMVLLLAGVLCGRQGPGKVNGLFRAVLDRLGANPSVAVHAKCAGLLGRMVNDLKPLGYSPADPRYRYVMAAVLGIFEKERSRQIEFKIRLEAAEALGQAGDPRLDGPNWILIKGKRGLKDFEIGKYPVTVAEYRHFVDDGGYGDERWWNAGGFGRTTAPEGWDDQQDHPNRPVVGVSWHEACGYVAWAGVRLVSDKEWEWAARGPASRKYPWGNEEPDATRANSSETGPKQVTLVGLYPCGSTPEGVEDMAGNVWEWVENWSDERRMYKVLRGGSGDLDASYLRSSYRYYNEPEFRLSDGGFRVAREVSFDSPFFFLDTGAKPRSKSFLRSLRTPPGRRCGGIIAVPVAAASKTHWLQCLAEKSVCHRSDLRLAPRIPPRRITRHS
jgi:hypothetical protein